MSMDKSQGSSLNSQAIRQVAGRGLPLKGHDIDTDRIMPARFLVASILVVNTNFGCGSSREHAPQGLVRAGYRAIVGESFSEIFQGNSAMLGMPCFVASHGDVERLQALIAKAPETVIAADVATGAITAGSRSTSSACTASGTRSAATGSFRASGIRPRCCSTGSTRSAPSPRGSRTSVDSELGNWRIW